MSLSRVVGSRSSTRTSIQRPYCQKLKRNMPARHQRSTIAESEGPHAVPGDGHRPRLQGHGEHCVTALAIKKWSPIVLSLNNRNYYEVLQCCCFVVVVATRREVTSSDTYIIGSIINRLFVHFGKRQTKETLMQCFKRRRKKLNKGKWYQWRRNEFESGGHRSATKRRKKFCAPPLFGSKSTISRLGERFRYG